VEENRPSCRGSLIDRFDRRDTASDFEAERSELDPNSDDPTSRPPCAIAAVHTIGGGDWARLLIETASDFFKQTVTFRGPSASTLSLLPATKDGLF